MASNYSANKPPQGTHFGDGVRTGHEFTSQYTPGSNAFTPSTIVASPIDSTAPGIFNLPLVLLDIVPAALNPGALFGSTATGIAAAGNLTLNSTNNANINILSSYQGVANVIQLDCARNISVTNATNTTPVVFTVYGWDQYGMPMAETITASSTAGVVIYGNKAFAYIRAVYAAGGTGSGGTQTISVGVGNTFGLPYFFPDTSYMDSVNVNGSNLAILSQVPATSVTTTNASAAVSLNLPANVTRFVLPGDVIAANIGGGPYNGITAAQLNIPAIISAVAYSPATNLTSISYTSGGTATSPGTVNLNAGSTFTIPTAAPAASYVQADQRVATATTGDVRGTVIPNTIGANVFGGVDGTDRVTIMYYAPGADARNYTNSVNAGLNNASVYLNPNPITTVGILGVVSVFAAGHNFVTGNSVTISGATSVTGGPTAAQLNITATVTVTGNDTFNYQSGANTATTNQNGGGSAVVMSPSNGTLYQTPIGYYGVPQYAPTTIL